jgi:Zn-finger protein
MYRLEHCPGNPSYIEKNGKRIKVCTDCTYPHVPEHYDAIMEILRNN